MVEAIIAGVVNLALLAATAGAIYSRVGRLERDMQLKVSKELYEAHAKNVEKQLDEIKALLQRVLGEKP